MIFLINIIFYCFTVKLIKLVFTKVFIFVMILLQYRRVDNMKKDIKLVFEDSKILELMAML